jgi:hypothetical protein
MDVTAMAEDQLRAAYPHHRSGHSRFGMAALALFALSAAIPTFFMLNANGSGAAFAAALGVMIGFSLGLYVWILASLFTLVALVRSFLGKSRWGIPLSAAVLAVVVLGWGWWVVRGPSTQNLMNAVRDGNVDAVRWQLRLGADPNDIHMIKLGFNPASVPAKPDQTPLTAVATTRKNRLEIVRLLVHHGADVNKPDGHGATPLSAAIGTGSPETVRLLLDLGARMSPDEAAQLVDRSMSDIRRNNPDNIERQAGLAEIRLMLKPD